MMYEKIIIKIILIVCTVLLVSCEGEQCAVGTVYDSCDNLPLDSVLCVSNGGDEILTDSTGFFDVCGPFGGCMSDCPEIEVEFSKEGYKSLKKKDDFEKIYLEKEE